MPQNKWSLRSRRYQPPVVCRSDAPDPMSAKGTYYIITRRPTEPVVPLRTWIVISVLGICPGLPADTAIETRFATQNVTFEWIQVQTTYGVPSIFRVKRNGFGIVHATWRLSPASNALRAKWGINTFFDQTWQ